MPVGVQRHLTAPSLTGSLGALSVKNLTHSYQRAEHMRLPVLESLSFELQGGQTLAVVGPSGCGKTTLLELLCGLERADHGEIDGPSAALMPQRDMLLPWFDALDNAALALRIAGHSRSQARAQADPMFAALGLDGFQRAHSHELSGGMRQRVAFARTLLSGKPLLCMDEPFGALDALTRSNMQRWLLDTLAVQRRTVVLVTHDVEEAILLADRVIVLSQRPAHLLAEFAVHTPHPRSHSDPEVIRLRHRALDALAESELML